MRSRKLGKSISSAEVSHISSHGLWILVDEKEHFLDYDHYPWFKDATVKEILRLERPQPDHLYWPDLDVDVELKSLARPEDYPLMYRQ